jgi:conjugative relaxase-like TrwC/TraI family protein
VTFIGDDQIKVAGRKTAGTELRSDGRQCANGDYGTAVYRNELAKRVREIGYRTVPAKHGFEIEGVSPDVLKRFSKRSQQRDAVVKELEQKLGHKLSNNAIALAVHQSRAKKVKGISTTEVRERQLAQLQPDELQALQKLSTSVQRIGQPRIAGLPAWRI